MAEWHSRFRRHYYEGSHDACWPWRSYKNCYGYGKFHLNGKSLIASRLAYELYSGKSPGSMQVLHSCDNPACVNPSHLRLGTHAQNMRERNLRGRARGGSRKGERHPRAKLTDTQTEAIRALAMAGLLGQRLIAAKFGISQTRVSEIRNMK